MASRLNLRFSNAPKQFLERTVLFTDTFTSPTAVPLMRNRTVHHVDFEPTKEMARARVLRGVHEYADTALTSYFVPPGSFALIPREASPYPFVFLPEFTTCRLLVQHDGETMLKLTLDENLAGPQPAPEKQRDSIYTDSFAYWDHTHGHLVGHVRATALLVKELEEPWTIYMQQIVGTPGYEVVRMLFSHPLNY